jgi:hypothetical protein
MKLEQIRRIRPENHIPPNLNENEVFKIKEWEDLYFYNDKIMLLPGTYKQLFKNTRKEEGYQAKKGIVKIVNPKNGRVIYRQYYGQIGLNSNEGGLTSLSLNELGISPGTVELNFKGANLFSGRIYFFWNHPNIEVRVPIKIAIISTIVGCISFILALLGIWVTIYLTQ